MPTHYNVKMKMLYALAICGLVRRDDLAIFAETMNMGSHDIMDLITLAAFIKVIFLFGFRCPCAALVKGAHMESVGLSIFSHLELGKISRLCNSRLTG